MLEGKKEAAFFVVLLLLGLVVGFLWSWWVAAVPLFFVAVYVVSFFLPESPTSNGEDTENEPVMTDSKWAPPPGVPVPDGGRFMRLTQHRGRGLSGMGASINVVCGACGWDYVLPSWVVKNYRNETTWGSSGRRFGQPQVALNQRSATESMRCPRCGSIDPGVWVKA